MKIQLQVDRDFSISYETNDTPEDFQAFMKGYLEFLTRRIVADVKLAARRQSLAGKWEPLSDKYAEMKKRYGLDPRIWIASRQTVESITYWYNKFFGMWMIGVNPRLLHRKPKKGGGYDPTVKQKVRVVEVVRFMEAGTRKMKARPLLTPIFTRYEKKSVQKKIYDEYLQHVKRTA